MRLCAALALVLVALVVATVKTTQRHPQRSAISIEREPDETAKTVSSPPPTRAAPAAPAESAGGIAHLRGRLLLPPGAERSEELVVVAEGTAREFRAEIHDDDEDDDNAGYEIHLPAGRYTLVASMGELVGVVPDVLARADGPRNVDIRLAVGAAIRGKVKAPSDGVTRVWVADAFDSWAGGDVEDGRFSIVGLIPGRRYDITFDGSDVRKLTIPGVTAPANGLDVELAPAAKVRGAIGFARGGRCPVTSAWLRLPGETDGDDDDPSKNVGADCKFALDVPDDAISVTVVATGKGWYLEQAVAIPPTSDPEPICLNPPCRSDPFDGLANLQITLDGGPGEPSGFVTVSEVGATPSGDIYRDHKSDGEPVVINGLPPGTTYTIKAVGNKWSSDEIQVTVAAGDNHVRLPCHRVRQIDGVVRNLGEPPEVLAVRCAGSDAKVVDKHFFRISCNANADNLEYQVGGGGTWRSVPIATAADPALVDIEL